MGSITIRNLDDDVKRRLDMAIDRVSQMLLQVSQPTGGEA